MEQTSIQLPPELWLQILPCLDNHASSREEWDFNSPYDMRGRIPPSLIACSLVCHTWNDICRPLIFRSILVDCSESVAHSDLHFLHLTAPHLCKHTSELYLNFSTGTRAIPEWLDACLSRFTRLRVLGLRYWSEMPQTARTPLARGIVLMLAATSLRRLVVIDWIANPNDLHLILSACSATLQVLVIDCLPVRATHPPSIVPLVVRLEALCRIELYRSLDLFTRSITLECPNLEACAISYYGQVPSELPSWIPERIPKLELQLTSQCAPLQFPRPIYPSTLTILIPLTITWPEAPIIGLPFLDHLRTLIIEVFDSRDELAFPEPESTQYEALCRLLQALGRPALPKRIIVTIENRLHAPLDGDELDRIRVRETRRLEQAFALFLEAGALSVELVVLHRGEDGRQVLV